METVQRTNCVLDKESVDRKIKRMALEVAEQNLEENEVIIAGIAGNGVTLAQYMIRELNKVATFRTIPVTIHLNKKDPLEVSFQPQTPLENKVILLVDDVANTGRTMFYALKPFLNARPRKIQTLVLVERSHKLFPIQSDYTGLSIATTLQEHIFVETNASELTGAYLR